MGNNKEDNVAILLNDSNNYLNVTNTTISTGSSRAIEIGGGSKGVELSHVYFERSGAVACIFRKELDRHGYHGGKERRMQGCGKGRLDVYIHHWNTLDSLRLERFELHV
jgi:hypothetical protein